MRFYHRMLILFVGTLSFNIYSVDVLHTYTGADGGNFLTDSNWDTGTYPNANNHTVTFNSANSNDPVLSGSATIKSLVNPSDSLSEWRTITGGGTLNLSADSGNTTLTNLDSQFLTLYTDLNVLSDLDVNLTAGDIKLVRALTGTSTKTINITGPTNLSKAFYLEPSYNADNNTFAGTIKLNNRTRLVLGSASPSGSNQTVQSTGLTIKAATTNSYQNILFMDRNQTDYDFQLDIIDNNTAKLILEISTSAGANAYTYSGSMYSRNSADSSVAAVNRSLQFSTNGKNLTISGDNTNLTLASASYSMQFQNGNGTTSKVYIDHEDALGENNGNKLTINDETGAIQMHILNNRTLSGNLLIKGKNDGVSNLIGGSDSGSASGSTTFSGIVQLNSNSSNSNTRNLELWSNNNESVTFSGRISDKIASNYTDISKTGTGTVILSADNTYAGSTTVSAGTLQIAHQDGLGESSSNTSNTTTTINSGATLAFNNSSAMTVYENLNLSGTGDSGLGAIDIIDGSHSIQGTIALSTASTIDVSSSDDTLTLNGVVSGSNALTKSGTGALKLGASNTYSGNTTVSAGSLYLNNSTGSAVGSGNLSVASGAYVFGTGSISGSLTNLSGTIDAGDGANQIGKITMSGSNTDFSNGTWIWNVSDVEGSTPGTHWDAIEFSSTYNLNNLSGSPLTLKIRNKTNGNYQSLEGLSSFGSSSNYGNAGAGDLKIMDNISNFNDAYFTVDSDILNINWELKQVGSALWLSYNAVPEPSTWITIGFVCIILSWKFVKSKFL